MTPEEHFERHLAFNTYPGRGLVIGNTGSGWVLIYWIMGRSAHSRNRRFVTMGSTLRTEPIDLSLVEDPSLIIYDAMVDVDRRHIVTNGDQTRTISEAIEKGHSFEEALATREREPDAPNYTPRISGLLDLRSPEPALTLSLLKANSFDQLLTDRVTFRPALPPPGYGVGLTTYMGNGSPLPPYTGDPLPLPCSGTPNETLEHYWKALNPENRISIAVKWIPSDGGECRITLINRFDL